MLLGITAAVYTMSSSLYKTLSNPKGVLTETLEIEFHSPAKSELQASTRMTTRSCFWKSPAQMIATDVTINFDLFLKSIPLL